MIYLDSSAILKLLFPEAHSAALRSWISERSPPSLVSSELARVEVLRAVRRLGAQRLPAARALLDQLDLIPLSSAIIDVAADLGNVQLRSLVALHVASAASLGDDLEVLVAYDARMLAAAAAAAVPTAQPTDQAVG